VLFICENNLYGASTPVSMVVKTATIAERACAYGIPGLTIDGNDVQAVYQATQQAAERARQGAGPTLIECVTYRQCGHSRSDPRTYRTREEEGAWKHKDPIDQFRARLIANGQFSDQRLGQIEAEVERTVQAAIAFAEASPLPQPDDLYADVFKE
jgi:pyruvate dehydrogenase E1 component alpha subunit